MKKNIFLFSLSFIFLFATHSFAQNEDIKAYKQGKAEAKSFRNEIGSVKRIEQKISKPMTSDTKMQTFGANPVSFDANISPKNTKKFVEIFMFPGGSGDLSKVIIKQDIDLNGTDDYAYEVNNLSGICTNGYISCNSGTWKNCEGYKWVNSGDSIKIIADKTSIQTLDSCYCINKSCGSNLAFSNTKTVLTSLGHGIVGAIQKANPHIAVTNSSFEDLSITYTGLLSDIPLGTGGNMETYTSGTETPEKLYKGPSRTNDISDDEKEAMRETALFQDISNANSNLNNPKTNKNCKITRTVNFSENKPYITVTNSCINQDLSNCKPETQKACSSENDCVYTIKNQVSTGLSPLENYQEITAPDGTPWQIYINGFIIKATNKLSKKSIILENGQELWWKISTTFTCSNSELKKEMENQKNIAAKIDRINQTTDANEGYTAMSYNDFLGRPKTSVLPYGEAPEQNCIPVCEVKINVPMNDIVFDQKGHEDDGTPIYEDAGRWENSNNKIKEQIFVKTCIDNQCPIDEDSHEIMTKDCACTNEFANAVSAISVADEMRKDIICSGEESN